MKMELTFGQMIDKLQVGQTAERDDKQYQCYWNINSRKLTMKSQMGSLDNLVTMTDVESKWTILPQYVTFEEAMKALKEGKKIRRKNDSAWYTPTTVMEYTLITFCEDFFEGEWEIEN
jgi:hypothetical protein